MLARLCDIQAMYGHNRSLRGKAPWVHAPCGITFSTILPRIFGRSLQIHFTSTLAHAIGIRITEWFVSKIAWPGVCLHRSAYLFHAGLTGSVCIGLRFHKAPTSAERRSSLAFAFWQEARHHNSWMLRRLLWVAILGRTHALHSFCFWKFGRLVATDRKVRRHVGQWNWSILPPDVVAPPRWCMAHAAVKNKRRRQLEGMRPCRKASTHKVLRRCRKWCYDSHVHKFMSM